MGSSANTISGRDDQRPGAGHPLLLPAGQLARTMRESVARCRSSSTTSSNHAWSTSRPAMSRGSVMFSRAVSVGTRLNAWKTNPTLSRRSSVSRLSRQRVRSMSPMKTWPRGRRVQPGHAVQQRGLPRSGRPHDRGELPRGEVDDDPAAAPRRRHRPRRTPCAGRPRARPPTGRGRWYGHLAHRSSIVGRSANAAFADRWARQVLNLRPLACEASALPLSYAPGRP